jgi:hypothetical protein
LSWQDCIVFKDSFLHVLSCKTALQPLFDFLIFTREYTKCTAGSTFCFVVVVLVVVLVVLVVLVVVVVGKPLIKLAGISADS